MEVQNHLQGRNETRDETIEGSQSDGSTISEFTSLTKDMNSYYWEVI
jgi:hypothetical protein